MRIWLKEIRQAKGLSQKQAAEMAGISNQMYSYVENGERIEPSKCDTEKKIAEALGFDWTLFFKSETT